MRGALLVAALLAVVPLAAAQSMKEYWTWSDDSEVAKVEAAVTKFCSAVPAEGATDVDDAKESLVGAVGDRPIYQAMKESRNNEEFAYKMNTIIEDSFLGSAQNLALFTVFSVLLCLCFTCTANPCCKNSSFCRPCGAVREHGMPHKAASFCPVVVASVVTIVGIATAAGGSSTMVAGMDNLACESATLLNSLLQGQTGQMSFIGLKPALNLMKGVEDTLLDNSQFILDLDAALADTKIVSDAIAIASSALDTMGDVLEHTATEVETGTPTYPKTYRKCEFCTTLKGILNTASTGLSTGVGQALANARNEVAKQLDAEKRTDIRKLVRESAQPMISMKEAFISTIGGLLDLVMEGSGLDMAKELIPQLVMVGFLGVFVVLGCGFCASACCGVKEKYSDGSYNKAPHRCACCTWLLAFPFAIAFHLVGGGMRGISTPLADVCLILDDLDGQMVQDIAPAVLGPGFYLDSTEGKSFIALIDNCINPADPTLNAAFLDLVFVQNMTTGQDQKMGEVLKDSISAPIKQTFDAIAATSSGSDTLSNSAEMKKLLDTIQNNPIENVIVVNPDPTSGMPSDVMYAPLGTSPNEAVKKAFATTLGCSDHTLTKDDGSTETLPGFRAFLTAFKGDFAWSVPGTSVTLCDTNDWRPRDCSVPGSNEALCNAGNNYVSLYRSLVDRTTFRCDVWEDQNGNDCDIYDMSETTGSTCLRNDGTLKRKQKTCSFSQFKAYYTKNHQRIMKAIKYVDYAVQQKKTGITTTLQNLVVQYFLNPMFSIFDGLTCGFLPGFWQEVVNSLCFQGIHGIRRVGTGYIMTSWFLLVLAIGNYVLWRRTIDNVNKSQDGAMPGVEAAL